MWWSRRAFACAAVASAAAGCGFSPAFAPAGPAAGLRGEIEVAAPNTRAGFYLTERLEERLGLPAAPAYTLRLAVTQGAQVTGVPADRVAARSVVVAAVDYRLVETATGRVLRRDTVQSFTGLSRTSTTAATRSAATAAERRLMTILADRIVTDLVATSEAWRG